MADFNKVSSCNLCFKRLLKLVILVGLLCSLAATPALAARPVPEVVTVVVPGKGNGMSDEDVRGLVAMLPKGVPLPPSGPSPDIN
ncbi:hypothetical protein LINPERHAP1_LOCUS37410 [Linum perenne]